MSQTPAVEPAAETGAQTGANPAADPVVAPPQARRPSGRGGLAGTVLGGALAAGLGFGAAQLVPIASSAPADETARMDAMAQALESLSADLGTLRTDLAALPPPETDALAARLTGLETRLAALNMEGVESRLAMLEARAANGLSAADRAALDGLRAEIEAIKAGGIAQSQIDAAAAELAAALDRAKAESDSLQAETLARAADAARRGALLQIGAALDAGAPYAFALQALDGVTIPEPLAAGAAGLPGLKTLQDGFPDAARAALAAARKADMGQTWTDRALSFLRTQVGARSLTSREGDDPDAVLSRAEAALTAGDVGAALAELAALPPEAQTALADWRGAAERRQSALDALAALSAELGL